MAGLVGAVAPWPGATASAQRVATLPPRVTSEPRIVTVSLENVPLVTAIRTIADHAGLSPMYNATLIPKVRVTLHVRNVAVEEAFARALHGTELVARIVSNGEVVIVRDTDTTGITSAGTITGTVVDAATKQPIRGALIGIDGNTSAASTRSDGTFRLLNVAAGTHRITIRRVGYALYSQPVTVQDNLVATVSVALKVAVTRLNEVVTTALGDQRRLEVGNVIAHLDVDSIAPTAPVSNLSDLLAGRVAGLQITTSSGMVGGQTSIRIRGQSSLTLGSDPIVIVDGVRQDNSPGGSSNSYVGKFSTPSRLNDLDYSQIESIDILKGPAASTEYGTDAANGVIVITTKKGKAGPPQWHAGAERGWSEIPVDFPEWWYTWGHRTDSTRAAVVCPLVSRLSFYPDQTGGTCIADSVVHDNPLNHRATSMFGSGLREKFSVDVGGGSHVLRYYLAGSSTRDVGTTRMPAVFGSLVRAYNLPSVVMDPNTQSQRSFRLNLSAHIAQTLEAQVSGAYLTTKQQQPSGSDVLLRMMRGEPVILDSAHYFGYGGHTPGQSPLVAMGNVSGDADVRATVGLTVDWRPISWFSGHVTTGVDHGSEQVRYTMYPQAQYISTTRRNSGYFSLANQTSNIVTGDVRGAVTVPLTPSVHSRTFVGLQVSSTKQAGVEGSAQNLSESNLSLNGVPNPQVTQIGDAHATVGGYLEQQLSIHERLFITGALRLDGASGFGGDYRKTVYPKLNASWLAWSANGNTVRLRSAFGAAGKQPDNGTTLQTYYATTAYVDGSDQSVAQMRSPGNPYLKPERSQEFEAGVDVSLWDNRLSVEYTRYDKHTKDALAGVSLGSTLGGLSTQENLGDVRNWGNELTLQASILRDGPLTWDMTVNASQNRNKLLRLGAGVTAQSVTSIQRHVVGYPLYGYWAQEKATYNDANHDGVLSRDELTLEDTSVYIGSPLPGTETSFSTQIGMFHGALMIRALLDRQSNSVIANEAQSAFDGTLRAENDSTAPLWQQAAALSAGNFTTTQYNFENASFIRFRELSATYMLPARWMQAVRFQSTSVTVAVRNLGIWSHYSGADPEVGSNPDDTRVDAAAIPLSRNWVVRCNIGF
jgi:TonB-linked SusC/RagA family outer membrane protein